MFEIVAFLALALLDCIVISYLLYKCQLVRTGYLFCTSACLELQSCWAERETPLVSKANPAGCTKGMGVVQCQF